MTARYRFYVALGSNLDDRIALIEAAIARLAALDETTLAARASIWETRPVGPGTGPYLNTAVALDSATEPHAMLEQLATIESELGRVRRVRWGDRRIDLDLIAGFDASGAELEVADERLSLPHPRVHERDFVLQPLVELEPELRVGGRRCSDSLSALTADERTLVGVLAAVR